MDHQDILSLYENVAELTGQMLAAAGASDWDRLAQLEQQCSAQVKTLGAGEAAVVLNGAGRQRKVELIKKVLADDRRIRDLTAPWMAQLSALIGNTGTQRRLASAYGTV